MTHVTFLYFLCEGPLDLLRKMIITFEIQLKPLETIDTKKIRRDTLEI